MQDVIAGDLRRAVARDQRERIERHRRVADIADVVLDGEEIALVDRDGAAEGEALAIVVFQHDRRGRRQRAAAFLLPLRVAVGHAHGRAGGGHPAELGVIGRGGAGRRIQHDRGRSRIDGVAELDQREIVDARALQRDAADQARGLDLDALRFRQRLIAADDGRIGSSGRCGGRGRGAAGLRRRARRRGGVGRLRRGLLQLGLLRLLRALPLHLRHVVEILPGEQDHTREDDGEDHVAVVGHLIRSRRSIRFCGRRVFGRGRGVAGNSGNRPPSP